MAELSAALGNPLFPAQRFVCDVALEVMPDGSWAYEEIILTMPRRSGKTFLIQPITAHRCARSVGVSSWITAQKRDNAVKRWREIADLLVAGPMGSKVQRMVSIGNEALRFKDSASVFRPFAPNEEDMHGEDPDLVWLDEWWSFGLVKAKQIEQGYKPAFSVKSGQAWKMSTAGTSRSTALKEDRARGRAAVESGGRERLAHFEWSIPERVGGEPVAHLSDDRLLDLIMANHPRAGHGLRAEYVADEIRQDRSAAIRAYGNVDQESAPTELFIGRTAWESSLDRSSIPDGVRVGVGVEVDPLGREATVARAWRRPDGVAVVETTQHGAGVRWAAPYASAMPNVGAVAVYNLGRSRDVADQLDADGMHVLKLAGPEMAAASARLHDGLTESGVVHDGAPALEEALTAAVLEPRKPWTSATGEPFTAVMAVSAALWAVDHLPAEEKPLPRFRIY